MTDLIHPPSTSGKTLMARLEEALLPLINLVFLLLMFFIVAGQIADAPLPELPKSNGASHQIPPQVDVLVTAGGKWQVSGELLTADNLLRHLPEPVSGQPLKVAAADSIAMSQLETLFRTLEQGGYTDILLLTEPAK